MKFITYTFLLSKLFTMMHVTLYFILFILFLCKLDNMCWFSHQRSRTCEDHSQQNCMQATVNMHCCHHVIPGSHTMESSAAVCSVRPTAHVSPCHALSMGMTQLFLFFLSSVTLTFDLDFRTLVRFLYSAPTAKFHHPVFNCLEVIMRTNKQTDNKQTPLKTPTSLRHTMPVGN